MKNVLNLNFTSFGQISHLVNDIQLNVKKVPFNDYYEFKQYVDDFTIIFSENMKLGLLQEQLSHYYTDSEFVGFPQSMSVKDSLTYGRLSPTTKQAMWVIEGLFPQQCKDLIQNHLDSPENEKHFDWVNIIKQQKFINNVKIKQRFTHTIDATDASLVDWWMVQLLYRFGTFKDEVLSAGARWFLPMAGFLNVEGEQNKIYIHPGNSRLLFNDLANSYTNFMIITKKRNAKIVRNNPVFVHSEEALMRMFKTHRADVVKVQNEDVEYLEVFFLPKDKRDVNDSSVLFFDTDETNKTEYLKYVKSLYDYHDGVTQYFPTHNPTYEHDLVIKLENSVITYQGEKVAYLDDNASLVLTTDRKFSYDIRKMDI